MNANTRTGRRIIEARRLAAKGDSRKRHISTHVAQVVADRPTRKAVTAALQKAAKPLRESGDLGEVRTRVCAVAAGVRGKTYRYNRGQLARIAAAYNPRKADYRTVRDALLAI